MIHIRVGHNDHVVLSAAETLNAFAVCTACCVDILCDGCGANKTNGLNNVVVQDRVNRNFVTVHDLNNALWKARFFKQFSKHQGDRWITFGWLENERVTACNGRGKHPHWNHRGEVEGRNSCCHTKGLAHRVHVNARASRVGVIALEQFRRADAIFNNLKATLNVAFRVWDRLAVLTRERFGQLVHVTVQQANIRHQNACTALWVCCSPSNLCLGGDRDGVRHLLGACEGNLGLNFACRRIVDVCEAARCAFEVFAINIVGKFLHGSIL